MIDLAAVLLAAAIYGVVYWWTSRRSRRRRRAQVDASARADMVNRRADRSTEVRAPRQL